MLNDEAVLECSFEIASCSYDVNCRLRMQESESTNSRFGANGVLAVGAVLTLIYFLCPYLLLVPLKIAYKDMTSVPVGVRKPIEVAFVPLEYLYSRVPVYRAMLDMEAELLGFR